MFNLRSLGSHFDTSSLALPPHFPFLMGRNTSLEPTACVSCRSTKSSEAPVQRKSSQLATADTSNERNIPRNLLLPAPKSMHLRHHHTLCAGTNVIDVFGWFRRKVAGGWFIFYLGSWFDYFFFPFVLTFIGKRGTSQTSQPEDCADNLQRTFRLSGRRTSPSGSNLCVA